MLEIRQAKSSEAALLTDIAARGESYWGVDPDFVENFTAIYRITENFINDNPTYVIEEEGKIIGFYGLSTKKEQKELEYLYIEPEYIGKGYGRHLWNHMIDYCKGNGIDNIVFVANPQAVGFYTKLGAVEIGLVESLVRKGRMVPKLKYNVQSSGRI